jgi:HD-GYP domain-containing protein (c-di-GMP phosphodiesterase class II)
VAYVSESARAAAGGVWFLKATEANSLLSTDSTDAVISTETEFCGLLRDFGHYFAVEYSLWNGTTGDLIQGSKSQPVGDQLAMANLVLAIQARGEAGFIFDGDGVLSLAVPSVSDAGTSTVATAWFVTRAIDASDSLNDASALLSMAVEDTLEWARGQEVWSPQALLRLAEAVSSKRTAEAAAKELASDVELVSESLASTFEEISLLHSVSQNLRISCSEGEIAEMATKWLSECLPAETFAVQYLPTMADGRASFRDATSRDLFTAGDSQLDCEEYKQLIEYIQLKPDSEPYIANANVTKRDVWPFPRIRQVIIVPLSEGNNVCGWLAAINHREGLEFGTVEAKFLNSLGALLAIHSSNRQLYREQADFVANVVRALVSAIDAKDPYTSGHSDRVSRIAVRIALELRCSPKIVNTIHMAGLLHDVGKIGIDDYVLRKSGRLTDSEFEHVKAHPEMGWRILADLKPLAEVLPAVLHHHEQWNGRGYPHGLKAEQTPLLARIMAVADSYDAMTSDRPYRQGMSEEKVDNIFREGAGVQWDPDVVKAFFAAKDDIAAIANREKHELVERWV